MSLKKLELKMDVLDEIDKFEEFLIRQRRNEGLPFKSIKVKLSNNNIYINVIAEKKEFGEQVIEVTPIEEYQYIEEVELRTYARRSLTKAVYVIFDYDQKKFRFGNTAKVNKLEHLRTLDDLPSELPDR